MSLRECPDCGARTYVAESREDADGNIRRYRVCHECGRRWKTVERLILEDKPNDTETNGAPAGVRRSGEAAARKQVIQSLLRQLSDAIFQQ